MTSSRLAGTATIWWENGIKKDLRSMKVNNWTKCIQDQVNWKQEFRRPNLSNNEAVVTEEEKEPLEGSSLLWCHASTRDCLTLKMKFQNVRTYQLTWCNIPQDLNLQHHHCQNLKSCKHLLLQTILHRKCILILTNLNSTNDSGITLCNTS